MAEYKIEGKIKLINETMTFPSGFSKREFVVTTQEQYPQDVKLEVVKDKCAVLDSFKAGDEVEALFDIRGNEYQGKYYVNLQAWRLSGKSSAMSNNPTPPAAQDLPPLNSDMNSDSNELDDLPF